MSNGLRWSEEEYARYQRRRLEDTDDMPEGVLLAAVRQLAKAQHWETYHTHDSRRSEAGFPDLVLTDGVSLLMMELKTNTETPTKAQEHWLTLLTQTGKVEAGVWRPRDWPMIAARLTRKETP